ncbi:L domain-like protein [Gonapodya prolifera JEL478]|uniref:L domain-like protein n=1 Tax=Gonapodya prolifera (strain JEL478) TaxID=1344416 RepID=A0A139AVL7_GONPJ|nr:L domain-like protein [Gonapodya prolifera JEL478]|eukprot:KXS20776.1 L domain-like protein [Gonapodya prolifera JEL478]
MNGTTDLIGQLPNLTIISLSDNTFSGNPTWIAAPSGQKEIYLDHNRFTGPVPDFSGVTTLTNLNLAFNNFSGSLPSFDRLTELVAFFANGNQLTGSILSLSRSTKLFNFQAPNNQLTGSLPDLSNNPRMRYFDVGKNPRISGAIPASFFQLGGLMGLTLSGTNVSGTVGDGLGTMRSLIKIDLSNTAISGTLPDLSGLANMTDFDVSNTALTGPLLLNKNAVAHLCAVSGTKLCIPSISLDSLPHSCLENGGAQLASCPPTATAKASSPTSNASISDATQRVGGGSTGNTPLAAILWSVAGCVVAIAILGGFFLYRRRPRKLQSQHLRPDGGAPLAPNQAWNPSTYIATFKSNLPSSAIATQKSVGSQDGQSETSTTTISTKVNDIFMATERFLALQADEISCEVGQKIFVGELFADEWCRAFNLDTKQTGMIPFMILVPASSANYAMLAKSMLLSGRSRVSEHTPRTQSVSFPSLPNKAALESLKKLFSNGDINIEQYYAATVALGIDRDSGIIGVTRGSPSRTISSGSGSGLGSRRMKTMSPSGNRSASAGSREELSQSFPHLVMAYQDYPVSSPSDAHSGLLASRYTPNSQLQYPQPAMSASREMSSRRSMGGRSNEDSDICVVLPLGYADTMELHNKRKWNQNGGPW